MSSLILWVIAVILLIVAVCLGYMIYKDCEQEEAKKEAFVEDYRKYAQMCVKSIIEEDSKPLF